MSFNNLLGSLADLIYPDSLYCICCKKIIDDSRPYNICNDCLECIKWIDAHHCSICGKRLSPANPGQICFSCREHSHTFDKGYTCTEYGEHERAMIFALKYGDRTDIARAIAEIMRDRMLAEDDAPLAKRYELLVPIPMYAPKLKQRGYNQAEIICREFARLTNIRYYGESLARTRQTRALKGLGPDERRNEMKGVFRVVEPARKYIEGARILLIDDIYTTGATMDAAADCLREAGAQKIDILTFAAGADVVK